MTTLFYILIVVLLAGILWVLERIERNVAIIANEPPALPPPPPPLAKSYKVGGTKDKK